MTTFTAKFAGVPIRISALFESSKAFCRDFFTEEEPVFEVVMSQELVDAERRHSDAVNEGISFSDRYLERLAIYRMIAEKILDLDILLFHGSAIAADGEGYLFTAPSGTGKSTHSRIWREELPKLGHEVFMVNDDKPLIRFDEKGIFVCGTPWNGKHGLGTNTMVPLKAVCRILRGTANEIRRVPAMEALTVLLSQSYRPEGAARMSRKLKLFDRMLREVGMYELHCNMEPEAALVSYRGMQG